MIAADLVALGVAFYDAQRGHGAADHRARHATVSYMRRKELEPFSPDAMPYHEALADALAARAAERIANADKRLFSCHHIAHDLHGMDACPLCSKAGCR